MSEKNIMHDCRINNYHGLCGSEVSMIAIDVAVHDVMMRSKASVAQLKWKVLTGGVIVRHNDDFRVKQIVQTTLTSLHACTYPLLTLLRSV